MLETDRRRGRDGATGGPLVDGGTLADPVPPLGVRNRFSLPRPSSSTATPVLEPIWRSAARPRVEALRSPPLSPCGTPLRYGLGSEDASDVRPMTLQPFSLQGTPVAPGLAVGSVHVIHAGARDIPTWTVGREE